MAQGYMTEETKERLDQLCEIEKRAIGDELAYLIDKRLEELSGE